MCDMYVHVCVLRLCLCLFVCLCVCASVYMGGGNSVCVLPPYSCGSQKNSL